MGIPVELILRELRERLEAIYGSRLVRMVRFGSHARGDAEPDSDIDVLVVLKYPVSPGREIARTSEPVSELCLVHAVVIVCVFMDEERFLHRHGPLLRNIRREGVPV